MRRGLGGCWADSWYPPPGARAHVPVPSGPLTATIPPLSLFSGLGAGYKRGQQAHDTTVATIKWLDYFAHMASTLVRSWPIAILGFSRLVLVKALGYQEHVSEYGVHWNFFATILFVRLTVKAWVPLCSVHLRLFAALAALFAHQYMLLGDLSSFIIDGPRDTFFSMNREGILGLVGFVAIYHIAEELGWQLARSWRLGVKVRWTLLQIRECSKIARDLGIVCQVLCFHGRWCLLRRHAVSKHCLGAATWPCPHLLSLAQEYSNKGFAASCLASITGLDVLLWVLTCLSNRLIQETSR